MAFPTGWNRKVALTIDNTKVGSGGVSNFDVVLTRANLPDEVVSPTDPNRAQSDGGDLRFSSDAAGSTRLACDVIEWEHDTSDGADDAVIVVRVKLASISSASDTTFYLWYNTSGTDSQPAEDAAYGQEATYDSNTLTTLPMHEDPSGSAPQIKDRTSNDIDGTSAGSMASGDAVASKVGTGLDFDGSDDYIDLGSGALLDALGVSTDFTISGWFNTTSSSGRNIVFNKQATGDNGLWMIWDTGTLYFSIGDSGPTDATYTAALDDGAWHHFAATYDYSTGAMELYVDGTSRDTATSTMGGHSAAPFRIGDGSLASYPFDGGIDETAVDTTIRSSAWITTTYNNQNSPSTFITTGTAVSTGSTILGPVLGGGPLRNNPLTRSVLG